MRIWIVHQYAYAPFHTAGTRHYSLARELIKHGHKVVIITTSFYHKARKETRLQPGEMWKRELIDGVPFIWIRTPAYSGNGLSRAWNMLMFTGRVWNQVGIRKEPKPDVIIGSSPQLFSAWAAERLSKKHRVPFILEVRDVWPEQIVDLGNLSPTNPLVLAMTWLESYLYRHSNRIITVLPKVVDHMVAKGANRQDVIWLPNGVALDNLSEPSLPQNSQVFTLMYAGAHGLYNGLDQVLDAAEILQRDGWSDRVKIRLIGDGPYKAQLHESAKERSLQIVSFEPSMPKAQIYTTLEQADAFLMILKDSPVFRWGISPNKLFDYMAVARPVLFAVGSSNDPIAEAKAGISVTPGSPQALADGIKALAQTPIIERQAMGQRGRAYVEEHNSFEKLGSKLEQVLYQVIRKS